MKVSKEIKALVDKHDPEQIKKGIKIEREHNSGVTDVIDGNLDLLKVALAHLEEDPKYYTHLSAMEDKENIHESYILEEGTGELKLLNELPTITVGKVTFDLEFEKGNALQTVYNLLMSKSVHDKHGNMLKLNTPQNVAEFVTALRSNPQAKRLVK